MFNKILYYTKILKCNIDSRSFFFGFDDLEVERPVFFIGNQGGGLTLVSRMIRRHPGIVSITGNNEYWAGADEMQRVMVARLPNELRLAGRILGTDPSHPKFTPPRSWSYACDDLVDDYHLTESDYSDAAAEQFRFLIREALHRHGKGDQGNRFVDKSQVFTLKIRYIASLLEGVHPHFVLITRNPYAACYRAAIGKAGDMERYAQFMDVEERVEVCSQHWANAMSYALRDGEQVEHFTWVRFEDMLRRPEEKVRNLCGFLNLEFRDDLLPAPHHELPLGSKYRDRWYPLRPEVNEKYLENAPSQLLDVIEDRCKPIAQKFGYDRP